ncbi:MAG: triose-phosphate isomerase [Candidatus Omnitrophica bacterium]|nr:triose-phosphate isomerase [Candidatus Omnitrophota bacterium]
MRKPIIAGNWKMNKTIKEAFELVNGLKKNLSGVKGVDMVVCPPFTSLSETSNALKGSSIKTGGQDLFWEEKGAYTGEISVSMLKDAGADYVIIGHSERRQFFNETNDSVNKKLKRALAGGLTPIVCVGERLAEREAGDTFKVVEDHVQGALKAITEKEILNTIFAYEPVWAIGTGKTATPEQAEEVHAFIRKIIGRQYSKEAASAVRIQYGGSVTPENISSLLDKPDVDGALVGGASLKVDTFTEIVRRAADKRA